MLVADVLRPTSSAKTGQCLRVLVSFVPRGLACLLVVVGAYGQVHDSLAPPQSPWSDLHAGFGALLFLTVGAHLWAGRSLRAKCPPEDVAASTCHLARAVYILLYSLAGLREFTNINVYLWQKGTLGVGWALLDEPYLGASSMPTLSTMDSFQVFVGYGFAAICLIRLRAQHLERQVTSGPSGELLRTDDSIGAESTTAGPTLA